VSEHRIKFFVRAAENTSPPPGGPQSRGRIPEAIPISTNTSASCCTKVNENDLFRGSLTVLIDRLVHSEGVFDLAEPHLLSSGTRDSARILAEMMMQWCGTKHAPGPFALHGTIP
jgi:hypothetical protein